MCVLTQAWICSVLNMCRLYLSSPIHKWMLAFFYFLSSNEYYTFLCYCINTETPYVLLLKIMSLDCYATFRCVCACITNHNILCSSRAGQISSTDINPIKSLILVSCGEVLKIASSVVRIFYLCRTWFW